MTCARRNSRCGRTPPAPSLGVAEVKGEIVGLKKMLEGLLSHPPLQVSPVGGDSAAVVPAAYRGFYAHLLRQDAEESIAPPA